MGSRKNIFEKHKFNSTFVCFLVLVSNIQKDDVKLYGGFGGNKENFLEKMLSDWNLWVLYQMELPNFIWMEYIPISVFE